MPDKTDYTFKKAVGREFTTNVKLWYEEFPGQSRYVHRDLVWVDTIPELPPASSDSVIQVYNTLVLVKDVTVSSYKAWKAEDPVGTRIRGFIPPIFGQGYMARIFDNADREIPTTDSSDWIFDYDNGVLAFSTNPVSFGWNAANIKLKAYRYIGATLDTQSSEWKNFVSTYADLPTSGNSLGDIRIIASNERGKSSLYRCVAISGSRDVQWQPLDPNIDVIDGGRFV
jgi:hypothetical protein